jgi:hypothetical protein
MKNNPSKIPAIAPAVTFIFLNSAGAAESIRIFAMAESGDANEFPMTPEEISAQDTAYDQIMAAGKKALASANGNMKVFEMGHTVAFVMTAAAIRAANAENTRLAAAKSAKSATVPEAVMRFEMSESGRFIEFPAAGSAREYLAVEHQRPATNDIRR